MAISSFTLLIDGVSMPSPTVFQWGLQDISASNSGRTDDSIMHKNRVAQKRKLSVSWSYLTWSEICKIVQAVNPEYMNVTYPDYLSGNESETRTFYVGDRSAPLRYWMDGDRCIETLSFDFIER